ncbi:ice-binding family protein [Hymenobacter baengnokdamensis]|uniref:ice-binding family protein n=1 Tax=Hymenobacter baengnokdamensis TaxID=2615203 RepID=UPI001780F39B|nr:ice-binding family protein [Hymenobacter baengnokdamensis]
MSTAVVLLHVPQASWAQAPPPLGVAASFSLFTAVGEVKNAGPTIINGDIGTNAGAFSGFPPGTVNGNIHVADTYSTQAATDVQTAYGYFSAHIPCATPLAIYGGTPAVTLTPGSYCVSGATTLAGTLILDAGGVSNAKFYLRVIGGALTTAANSQVVLAGGATADNVYWQISGGAVNLGQNSTMQGTLLVDGAISMDAGTTLIGRGLSRSGAILPSSTPTAVSTFSLPVVSTTSWLGTAQGGVSTDWYTAANWSNGVPTSTLAAVVPTGTTPYPVIANGSAAAKSLTIGLTASLTQAGGTLDVKNTIDNSGTISATGGTVTLTGTTAQGIGGSGSTQFWGLTVANSAGASQTNAISVHGILALTSGSLSTNGQSLTLLSDVLGTALVVQSTGNVVNGNATVQRYIDASGNIGTSGYRHYSSPISNATVASLNTRPSGGSFTPVVNPSYNTAVTSTSVTPYPTVYGYDQSRLADATKGTNLSAFDKGYVSPTAPDLSDPLVVGQGYTVQLGNTEKVQFTGPLNNGNLTIGGLQRGSQADAGWQLLGNPYPAPLDWNTVSNSQLTGVDPAVYVFQSTEAYKGRYTSFTNNVGAGNGLIATGQGFFVRASTAGVTGSIALTNANRVATFATTPAFQRTASETRPLLRLSLGLGSKPATIATAQDEAFVYYEQGATAGYDGKFDAYKLANPSGYYLGTAAQVAAGTPGLGLSISGRSPLASASASDVVPVWLSVPAGSYTLTATSLVNFAAMAGGTSVQLRDALTGTLTNLAATPSYSFEVAANAPGTGRFSLVFGTASALATAPATMLSQPLATLYPNPAEAGEIALAVTGLPADVRSVDATLVNAVGQELAHYAVPAAQGAAHTSLPTTGLAGGVYLVRLRAQNAQGQLVGNLPAQRLSVR